MNEAPKKKPRLSRSDWLARAMEVLSREGGARLNVNDLCQSLGVTKGSFYAHFDGRADFVEKFVVFWAETFTQSVIFAIDQLVDATPEARLLALMCLLKEERLARYDVAVRAWAAQELIVAEGVRQVDRQRFDYVRQIFQDMGFRGADLDIRTRLFVVFHSAEPGMRLPSSGLAGNVELQQRLAFFERP